MPEVTYRRAPDVASYWFFCRKPTDAFDICPTGRTIAVRYKMEGGYYEVENLDTPPGGSALMTERSYHNRFPYIAEIFGEFEDERATRGSFGAKILSAPFDYYLAPVLSATTTTHLCHRRGTLRRRLPRARSRLPALDRPGR